MQYKCLLCGEIITDGIDDVYSHLSARHCISAKRIVRLDKYIKCTKETSLSHRGFVKVGYTDDFWTKAVENGKISRLSYHTPQRCQRCSTNVYRGYTIIWHKGLHFICYDCKDILI